MTLANDPAVLAFRGAAERYRELVRDFRAREWREFLPELEVALVGLYANVLALPVVEPGTDDLLSVVVGAGERGELFRGLHEYFGPHAFYWEVYDPIERSDDDVLTVGLADDLADIYCDLSSGLAAWDITNAPRLADIVWDWRFNFESHWGQHLVDALRALHWLRHVHHVGASEHPESAV